MGFPKLKTYATSAEYEPKMTMTERTKATCWPTLQELSKADSLRFLSSALRFRLSQSFNHLCLETKNDYYIGVLKIYRAYFAP